MSDNKKTITLDENNTLVVENDNATIAYEGTTSKISGKYNRPSGESGDLI